MSCGGSNSNCSLLAGCGCDSYIGKYLASGVSIDKMSLVGLPVSGLTPKTRAAPVVPAIFKNSRRENFRELPLPVSIFWSDKSIYPILSLFVFYGLRKLKNMSYKFTQLIVWEIKYIN